MSKHICKNCGALKKGARVVACRHCGANTGSRPVVRTTRVERRLSINAGLRSLYGTMLETSRKRFPGNPVGKFLAARTIKK